MQVTVNHTELTLFTGARAGDAVRAYYAHMGWPQPFPLPLIRDRRGFETAPDGALTPGAALFVDVPVDPPGLSTRTALR